MQVTQWLSWDLNMKDKQEVEDLIKNGQQDELKKLFNGRIAFGTAGLRFVWKLFKIYIYIYIYIYIEMIL